MYKNGRIVKIAKPTADLMRTNPRESLQQEPGGSKARKPHLVTCSLVFRLSCVLSSHLVSPTPSMWKLGLMLVSAVCKRCAGWVQKC